jgi:hypothetical protein
MIMLCLVVKLSNVIDKLYLLMQQRQYYGHVRYAGTVRRRYEHAVSAGKFETRVWVM